MSILPCSFIFLLLLPLDLMEAERRPGEENAGLPLLSPRPAQRPRKRSAPRAGRLTTKGGHRCTWQTSGEVLVNLLVNCSTDTPGDQQRYWCRYAGKPDLCPAYGEKSSQYWKQLLGKVKKRHNACEGEKVLRAKTCKGAASDAHMKLSQSSREDGREGKRKRGEEERKKGEEERKKGEEERKKGEEERKKGEEERKRGEEERKKGKERKKGEERSFEEERKKGNERSFEEEGVMDDMQPVQSYCSDGWSSVCSVLLRIFEG